MNIAIDLVCTNVNSGTKSYNMNFCKSLCEKSLDNRYLIFITKKLYNELRQEITSNNKIEFVLKSNFLTNAFLRLLWMQLILPFEIKFKKINTLYSPMNIAPLIIKIFNIKLILTLHSNLPWIYFDQMPGNYFRKIITKKFMELSIYSAAKLIVNSHYAKQEISKILFLNPQKIHVVYLGIDNNYLKINTQNDFYIKNFDYKKKYILSVISCVKYHNIVNLLKAFRILKKENNTNCRFVFVMQVLDIVYYKVINDYINKNFKKDEIYIFQNLNSNYLKNLYKHSKLYIFSSNIEVFGLTSLEAMSQGVHVLVSNKSALPEINSDAAEYFDPDNVLEIKELILKNLNNDHNKEKYLLKATEHIKKFSWKKNLGDTLEIINGS